MMLRFLKRLAYGGPIESTHGELRTRHSKFRVHELPPSENGERRLVLEGVTGSHIRGFHLAPDEADELAELLQHAARASRH